MEVFSSRRFEISIGIRLDRNMKSSREHNTRWRKQAKGFLSEESKIEELMRDVKEFIAEK